MSNTITFTKKRLDSLPIPEGRKRPYYHDTEVNGLMLRITNNGVKSFAVQRRIKGRVTKVTLGRYPDMTIHKARNEAVKTLGAISDGINPNKQTDSVSIEVITLSQVLNDYITSRGTNLKQDTIKNYMSIFNSYLCDWKDEQLLNITRDDVEKKHREITQKSPTRANTSMRLLRALFNYALGEYEASNGQPIIIHNPTKRLSHIKAWNREPRRREIIKSYNLKNWYKAVQELPDNSLNHKKPNQGSTVRDLLVFILFTGLRRREATNLMWDNVDFIEKSFTIHNTKNYESHTLPLTDFLLGILKRRKSETGSSFVFEGISPDKPINDPKKQIKKVREISGVNFTMHDLRRTFATAADSLDMSSYALKKLLNHKDERDVTIGYIVTDVERLRSPMEQITHYFLEQIK